MVVLDQDHSIEIKYNSEQIVKKKLWTKRMIRRKAGISRKNKLNVYNSIIVGTEKLEAKLFFWHESVSDFLFHLHVVYLLKLSLCWSYCLFSQVWSSLALFIRIVNYHYAIVYDNITIVD